MTLPFLSPTSTTPDRVYKETRVGTYAVMPSNFGDPTLRLKVSPVKRINATGKPYQFGVNATDEFVAVIDGTNSLRTISIDIRIVADENATSSQIQETLRAASEVLTNQSNLVHLRANGV